MQIAAVYKAAGAKGVEMPSVMERRAALDASLAAPVVRVTPKVDVLHEALGLQRAC